MDGRGTTIFLAASVPHPSYGAAVPPSEILASLDGRVWRHIGEVPGWAVFGAADTPIVSFIKNDPRDGMYRVEAATDLASVRLVAIPGSWQAWSLYRDACDGSLWQWSWNDGPARRSTDERRWTATNADRINVFFSAAGTLFGASSREAKAWRWDGSRWSAASLGLPPVAASAEADGYAVLWAADGSVWRVRDPNYGTCGVPVIPLPSPPSAHCTIAGYPNAVGLLETDVDGDGRLDCVAAVEGKLSVHVVLRTASYVRDLGEAAMHGGIPGVRLYTPPHSRVLVVAGTVGADASDISVFHVVPSGVDRILRAGGKSERLSTAPSEWPTITVGQKVPPLVLPRTYVWNGTSYTYAQP